MSDVTWKHILATVTQGRTLTTSEAAWAMQSMMSGEATDVQIAAFVSALHARGETAEEIRGLVDVMVEKAIQVPHERVAVDVVGTGGDLAHTVNISTMSALVVAGAGAPVLKHGNRAISSKTGTADVLEALGVAMPVPTEFVGTCLADAGIAFCFAPAHHSALKYAANVRKELAVPTVFNVLGPLANPGQPQAALLGCADAKLAPVLAQVQADRGKQSIVVRGDDGLDEITTATTTQVWDVTNGTVRHSVLDPVELGLVQATPEQLRGGEAAFNAQVVRDILNARRDGNYAAIRDVVAVNSAATLVAYDAATGEEKYGSVELPIATRIASALAAAYESIDAGNAMTALNLWISVSQRLALGA